MRYTEQPNDFNFETLYDYVRSGLILFVFAPLRLCKEISTKVVFLSKDLIQRILICSMLILAILFFAHVGISVGIFHKEFSLLQGKVPPVLYLGGIVCLAIGYGAFVTHDLVVYQRLEDLIPNATGVKLGEDDTKPDVAKDSGTEGNKEDFNVNLTEDSLNEILRGMNISDDEKSATDVKDAETVLPEVDLGIEPEEINDGEKSNSAPDNGLETDIDLSQLSPDSLDDMLKGATIDPDAVMSVDLQSVLSPEDGEAEAVNDAATEEGAVQQTPSEKGEESAFSKSVLSNPDLIGDKKLLAHQDRLQSLVAATEKDLGCQPPLTEEEKQALEESMDNSRDPSKYLDESNLTRFFSEIGMDTFGSLDDLMSWCTPSEFKLA